MVLLLDPLRVIRNKLFPTARSHRSSSERLFLGPRFQLRNRCTLKPMAHRHSQTVRRIKVSRQSLQMQQIFQHQSHLLLRCRTTSGDRLLHFPGGILRHRNTPTQRCRHGHSLSPAQLQHTLDIFPEKGRFEGYLIGAIFVDQSAYPIEYVAKFLIRICDSVQINISQNNTRCGAALHSKQPIPRHVRTGIDSHNNLRRHLSPPVATAIIVRPIVLSIAPTLSPYGAPAHSTRGGCDRPQMSDGT